ncbi:MAG TPA: cytochrome c [Chloroflexota bacterium]
MRQSLAGVAVGALAILVLAFGVLAPLALAHRQTGWLEDFYGGPVMSLVSGLWAAQQPPATASPESLDAGRAAYADACSQCHGAAGDGRAAFGLTTHPLATDLTSRTATEKSDAQLFWIVKNGLGFTAMPAAPKDYSDADVAAVVAYVRSLQHAGR